MYKVLNALSLQNKKKCIRSKHLHKKRPTRSSVTLIYLVQRYA